ncbi:questin oxidase family protein [Paucibacter soli]|uniref:questin oxidase family protein n=1 Tax=Paucibacter soli TaxID=3133433 RepID=UPI0030A39CBD
MQLEQHHALHLVLDEALRYGPSYTRQGLRLSSHLPMRLTALARLGADAAQLQAQLRQGAARLEPTGALRAGLDLDALLPRLLLQAPEAMAFHGAIRMAYALDAGHAGEQAAALDAWLAGAVPAPVDTSQADGSLSLRDTLDRVRADPALAMQLRIGTTIMSDLQVAQRLPGFSAYLALPRLSLEALAEASLAAYLAGRDFTALHLVTGVHALRVLLAHVRKRGLTVDEGQVLRGLWRAWLAAYVAIERPALPWALVHAGTASEADWQAQLPALHRSGDEHRIKLADTAREEWRLRGWPGYALCLQAAAAAA